MTLAFAQSTVRAALRAPMARRWVALRTSRSVKTSTVDWKPIKSATTDLAKLEQQAKHSGMRYFFLSLMVAMPVVLFALGCWQVKRLDWKTQLITRCENLLLLPPMEDLPADLSPDDVANLEYRKVKLRGHFDYDQEMFLGPRKRHNELGYLLVCPFVRSLGGKPILVERGWILKDKVVPQTRAHGYLLHLAMPRGEIEIVAMIRVMPPRSLMQYEHDKGSRQFFVPDVAAMAEQSGALPIYCQALYDLSDRPQWRRKLEALRGVWDAVLRLWRPPVPHDTLGSLHDSHDATLEYQQFEFMNEGVPIGTIPKVVFTNNHMQYLVTWFALLFFSTGLLVYSLAKGRPALAEQVIGAKRQHMKNL